MKKAIIALCCLILLKSVVTSTTAATPVLQPNYTDTSKPKITQPSVDTTNAEDSTASMADTTGYGTAKTVKVKGYYRKDGKYVAPYTRSAPRKKH